KYGPVGCAVLADRIYPQLIGNDIGCGMSLFQLDLPMRKLKLDKAVRRMRKLGDPADTDFADRLEQLGLPTDLFPTSLGTIGGGNHFCEVQTVSRCDPDADLDTSLTYLLVHSGSRGLGDAVFGALPETAFSGLLSCDESVYVKRHDQAAHWASLNRQIIAERAAEALRADLRMIVDAPHNLLSREAHGWLHRKGAAKANMPLVPLAGSRDAPSYLLRPVGLTGALGSTAHGAGRRYDRASMRGRIGAKQSDITAMERTSFGGRVLCEDRDLLIEEAPSAYKSADQVVADLEMLGVARPVATFHPVLTFKKIRTEGRA
ncbi:MAG: RtcB family protein, partial [Pseudomonadota bacterium]